MKKLTRAASRSTAPYTKRLVFLRIALGILLCIKGNDFIQAAAPLQQLLLRQQSLQLPVELLSFVVGWAQVAGSVFIVLGLFTRIACIVQLLIITVGLLAQFSNFTLSDYAMLQIIVVFSGLTLFVEKGGGKLSLDRLFKFNQSEHLVFWA